MIASLDQTERGTHLADCWTGLSRVSAVSTVVATAAVLSLEQVLVDEVMLQRAGSMALQDKG